MQRFRSLILFAVSGCLALGVDIGVLYVCRPWLGDYAGRLLSFLVAATFTWQFNRHITFKGPRQGSVLSEYLLYLSSMALGGVLNYGSYAVAVATMPMVKAQPAIGVAIGSLVGLGFNFLSARRILHKKSA